MDCREADELMMKYMDGTMSEEEALRLGSHVEPCINCKEAFAIYDMMIDDFSEFELIEAPKEFEAQVMEKINELPSASERMINHMDNVVNLMWGGCSVLLGIAALIATNRDLILNYMLENAYLASYAKVIQSNIEYFQNIFVNAENILYSMTTVFNAYVAESRYFILAIFAVLITIQIYIHRKEKVGA